MPRVLRNKYAPKGTNWCHYHPNEEGVRVGAYLPVNEFNKNNSKASGLNDRCRSCDRDYRVKYEELHGRRTDKTKTLRVAPRIHALAKAQASRTGAAVYQYVGAAIVFYVKYGCEHPGCTRPRSLYGKCDKHLPAMHKEKAA